MEERFYAKYTIFKWTRDGDNKSVLKPMAEAESPKELREKLQQIIDRRMVRLSDIIVNYPPIEGIQISPAPDFIVTLPDDLG